MDSITDFDLSLVKNQNELAIKISKFFTKEELDSINLANITKKDRDIQEIQYIYCEKDFENGKSAKVIDTLILDRFPACRYVTIRLSIGEREVIEYKCKFNKNIIKQLHSLFSKIYNYKHWGAEEGLIIKSHIMNNFVEKISSDIDNETLEEVIFVITYLINDGSIKNDNSFNYDFSINGNNFNIESTEYHVSFSYKKENDKFNKIYFDKTDTGISNINLIIRQAINL